MYNTVLNFSPNEIYLNIDFNKIKNNLKQKYKIQDYISILILEFQDFMITVYGLGKMELYLQDNKFLNKGKEIIYYIESLFQQQIDSFKLKKPHIYK